jgi:hypothetical protein
LRLSAGGGAGGCGIEEQGQACVGGALHGLEVEVEDADDRLADPLWLVRRTRTLRAAHVDRVILQNDAAG